MVRGVQLALLAALLVPAADAGAPAACTPGSCAATAAAKELPLPPDGGPESCRRACTISAPAYCLACVLLAHAAQFLRAAGCRCCS